jgi:carbamoyltransferase
MYSAFTSYCGFKVNSGEYKLMGLAPYGNRESEQCRQYKKKIFEQIIDVRKDGSFLLNMDYFDYVTGLQMCNYKKWENLFGLKRRLPESDLTQPYMDMALACQQATEEIVLSLCRTAQELTGTKNLVMAGGVALNCVANGKIMQEKIFNNIWIQPAAGDAGGALGAAYAARHIWAKKDRKVKCIDSMKGAYLGPAFTNDDVVRLQRQYGACFTQYDSFSKLIDIVSSKLDNGSIVGWFQGRMEWGPRALGNRSILADPRNEKIQKRLNLKIKFREGFRPFAPSVMVEAVNDYFELNEPSPYMLHVASVNKERCNPLPDGYEKREMYERFYFKRSDIPAITHVDYSARIQTVDRQTNEKYWKLINAFKEKTGFGLLVNTSFNVRGEPIVCTPGDAFKCFMMTQMDLLVINDCLFIKQEQPNNDWLHDFELD